MTSTILNIRILLAVAHSITLSLKICDVGLSHSLSQWV